MVSANWRDDGLEDWEHELTRPDGHPLLALLVGAGFLVVAGVLASNLATLDVARHAPTASGVAVLAAALVWAAAWLLTLRHASTGWQIGAGATFLGIALFSVAVAVAVDRVAMRLDIEGLQQIKINARGEPELPPGMRAGPVSRAGLSYLRKMIDEGRKREALLTGKLGIDRLTDAAALVSAPQLLTDCGRFKRAKPEIDASDQRATANLAQFRHDLDSLITDRTLHEAALKGIDRGGAGAVAELKEGSRLQQSLLDQAGGLCRLLSARHWRANGPVFEFTSAADLSGFNRAIGPWNENVREQREQREKILDRMRANGRIDSNSRF